jgi:TM2 domain-containing membrane protein YozV
MPKLYRCSGCGHSISSTACFCTRCRMPGPLARHPNSWRTREPYEAIQDLLAQEQSGNHVVPTNRYASESSAPSFAMMRPSSTVNPIVVITNPKNSGLAAVLSFFWCGLGQIYTGQILKGMVMMVFFPAFVWLGVSSSFIGILMASGAKSANDSSAAGGLVLLGLFGFLMVSFIWIYGMVNAYRRAEALNQQQVRRFN